MSAADTSAVPGEGTSRFAAMLRYGVGISAPASVAVAHFAVQLFLLRHLPPAEFGTFALLMVIIQLGYGLSNALIATPYTIALHDKELPDATRQSFFGVNALYAAGFALASAAVGLVFAGGAWVYVFALYSGLAMVRWFGRAHCYAVFRQFNAAASDVSYSVLVFVFLGVFWLFDRIDLLGISAALLAATLGSLVAIRSGFLGLQFGPSAFSSLSPYAATWRTQSRWSLLGVVTTEATSNAHAYLVSALAGPAAFAPLAAASLFTRPVALAITSLTQLERPPLSRAIAREDIGKARAICRTFLIVLLLIWAAVSAVAGVVLIVKPGLLAGQHYAAGELQTAFVLLAIIALLQVIQTPASVFLQAAKQFRLLALSSTVAAGSSIVLAVAALMIAGPVYSLLGIIAGKLVMTLQILHRSRNWRADHG